MDDGISRDPGAPSTAIDAARLWQRHVELARFGATPGGGVTRLALSAEEFAARAHLIAVARARGLEVAGDAIGNLFVTLPGKRRELAPVLTGSHIDTQPLGGRFDGIYGVLAGLEVLESLAAAGRRPQRDIVVAAWNNEEASRFLPGAMGSRAYAHPELLDTYLAVRDRNQVSVAEAMAAWRAAAPDLPERPLGGKPAVYVEAHIEQGPILEAAGLPIGVVTGIQGIERYAIAVTGESAHAGTTPRARRRDAMQAATALASTLYAVMRDDDDVLRFTINRFEVTPNATAVVAGRVTFTIDMRHPDAARLAEFRARIGATVAAAPGPCRFEMQEISRSAPIAFSAAIQDQVERAARARGHATMRLPSGAGHDAMHLVPLCPTGMIFVPCERGISHNEAENATAEHLAAGAQVLADVLVSLAEQPG